MKVRRHIKGIFKTLFVLYLFLNAAQAQTKKMIWGVCGHPLAQEAYMGNWDLQSNTISNLGVRYYRIDLITDKNGIVKNDQFLLLVKHFKKSRIELLPILMLNYSDSMANTVTAYQAGYLQGSGFSRQYGMNFNYYEIGNEQDNSLILSANLDGNSVTNYNLKKGALVAAYMNGMIKGIKKYHPMAQTIINSAFVHFGFFDLLKKNKVKFDILGVHWYSDMGNLFNKPGYGDLLDTLYKNNRKNIWITEFNWREGTKDAQNKSKANKWVESNMKYIASNPHVKGFFIYELFDEPAFEKNTPGEAFYGLVRWINKYNSTTNKEIYYAYKKELNH